MTTKATSSRRIHVGAELQKDGVHFRVWAPARSRVAVVVDGHEHPMRAEEGAQKGYFEGRVDAARAGSRYRYRLDGGDAFPDPASRSQPEGPHGASEVVDPAAYAWRDAGWRGSTIKGSVVYELHFGTFTREGTYAAAARELPRLKELGITLLEAMPIAEFPGAFGWGYDGVDLYAPAHIYGSPDDLRRFIDEAHAVGLGVILDVVYNHFGPDGCYLRELSKSYFTSRYKNDWGEAINYDGDDSGPVRDLIVANAGYWIDEFHFDGLRLDATQSINDASPDHVIAALARRAREAAGARSIVIVAENEPQQARLARAPAVGGYGLDSLWNDDFHHSAAVAATGKREAYYSDTHGTPQELIAAVKWGFLFQGQRYAWQEEPRGAPALDLPSAAFVTFLENHDQVSNSARGERMWQRTARGRHRALVALWLLAPQTPMLFQGEEFDSSSPFLFFADHHEELGKLVAGGRAEFLRQFPSMDNEATRRVLDSPSARATFDKCKLDAGERDRNVQTVRFYRDLLRLRRDDLAFAMQRGDRIHGTVLSGEAFALRFFCDAGDRLVVVNLGVALHLESIADPIVAPPHGPHWRVISSTEDPAYGGDGACPVDGQDGWRIGGQQTTVLAPPADER